MVKFAGCWLLLKPFLLSVLLGTVSTSLYCKLVLFCRHFAVVKKKLLPFRAQDLENLEVAL